MPALILRGLDRERYGVVKAFAALPPKAWERVCRHLQWNGQVASVLEGDDPRALELLAERITAFFKARTRNSV